MGIDERGAARDALGAYWNALVTGTPDRPDGRDLDPGLTEAVRWLHGRDDARSPDPTFVARLERSLANTAVATGRVAPSPAGWRRPGAGRIGPPAGAGAPTTRTSRRPWSLAPLVSAALVLVVLAASVFVFAGGGSGGVRVAETPSLSAGPLGTPLPEECVVAPRDPASILTFGGSPIAEEVKTEPLPSGEPADAETVATVVAAVREWTACGNAGDPRRWIALFSDRYVNALVAWDTSFTLDDQPPADLAEFLNRPATPQPAAAWIPMPTVRDVRILPDGRVAATLEAGGSADAAGDEAVASIYVFVRAGDRLLIDDARPVVEPGAPTFLRAGGMATVGWSGVRLREGPSGTSSEVERLPRDAGVRITGEAVETDGTLWWPVEHAATGQRGYVLASYLLPAPEPPAGPVDQAEVVLRVAVDAAGVTGGEPAALETARSELRRALDRYAGCRVAVARVLGPEETPPVGLAGTELAEATAAELHRSFPDLFAGTDFETLVDDQTPPDHVDLRLYFYAGCAAAGSTPVA